MSVNSSVILKAEFHPVLVSYLFIYVLGFLLAVVVGIFLIPFWLLIGYFFCKKYYQHLECNLTEKTLELKKGFLFHVEKTIPLDKIQDLTLREGPLLRAFKIAMLDIETAGQSGAQGSSDAKIIGMVNAREFRDQVLAQRDKLVAQTYQPVPEKPEGKPDGTVPKILTEIRDILYKIEKQQTG